MGAGGVIMAVILIVIVIISVYLSSIDERTVEVSSDDNGVVDNGVIITDVKMKFGSMVVFMVKWVIASIPAMIILFLVGFLVMGVFGVGIATLFK